MSLEQRESRSNLPAVKAPSWIQGFVDFIRGQGVVGVAIGLIIGLGAKTLVDSFVASFINPIVGVILGGSKLSSKFVCIQSTANGFCTSKIGWGQFVNDLISFIIIAFIVYFVAHILKLDKLDKKKES